MTRIKQKTSRSRTHGLMLFCAFVGVYLSSSFGLLISPARAEVTAPGQISLLARLSLTDSAVSRFQKLNPDLGSKSQRRHEPLALSTSGNETAPLELRNNRVSAFQRELFYSLVAISPPSDRAPPPLV
ncbi:MAG TPA: hypothetical protein VJZ26_07390 [Blastocatellia bacterium]|nr:hypothetical protein [Blastocatellia bacterium]